MKVIKRLLFFIAVLIVAGCIGIVICALNPALTNDLANKIRIWQGKSPYVTMKNSGDGTVSIYTGIDIGVDLSQIFSEKDPVYVIPDAEEIDIPTSVVHMGDMKNISEDAGWVDESEADEIEEAVGSTGEGLEFDTLFYPYYAMLTDDMKKLYCQIYSNALDKTQSFTPVVETNTNQLKTVFEAVYNDHPELFWLETGYSCKYLPNGKCVEITMKYNQTAAYLEEAKQQFDSRTNELVKEASLLATDEEKERYVHDRLLEKAEYNVSAKMNQSAYSALVNGESVCAGYSRAMQHIMIQLGIPCYYCTGYAGESHAWNIIKLGSKYFNVDTTWADLEPPVYDFYNKSDEEYASTHMRTGLSVYLPACQGERELSEIESLINQDPQKPINWKEDPEESEAKESAEVKDNGEGADDSEKKSLLREIGVDPSEVAGDLDAYYTKCYNQLIASGSGLKQFSNVIPEELWNEIEKCYTSDGYMKGYVNKALETMGLNGFAIQLQTQRLGNGYLRLYHNVNTW